jgi:beta-lactamase regulating signal transducer with metallopeptidase domain
MSWFEWLEWTLLLAGLAVLHLGWQTCLAGMVVAGLARLADRVSAQLRYSVALALYLSLPLLAVTTAGIIAASRGAGFVTGVSSEAFPGSASWIAAAAPWVGLFWALGVMVGAVRLMGGVFWTARIRRAGRVASTLLVESTRRLVERMGIGRPTSVRISDDVQVPSVVGLLSPTLLLPLRLLSELDDGEIDAILAHELSHVRRRDLLANVAQRLVSTLLFFHPVARSISRTIDRDREVCCDDLVTGIGVPRRTYARALARVAVSSRTLAGGLGAGTGDVAARVRRLMRPVVIPANGQVFALTLALLVATLVGWSVMMRALLPASTRAARTAAAWEARVLADGVGSYTVNAIDPAGEFTLSVENGRAVGATIAGSALPRQRIRQRGARVTLQADRPGETFSVRLVPSGGIEWPARAAPVQH